MIDRPPGPPLDGDTELRIGVDGMDGSGDADSGFCATLLAMAGHDLRQPLQVIGGAHDVLAPILHRGAAQAQLARVEDATRQLADKAYGRTNWTLCPRKSAARLTMNSPSARPSERVASAWRKALKTLPNSLPGMPIPLSRTSRRTCQPRRRQATNTRSPQGV